MRKTKAKTTKLKNTSTNSNVHGKISSLGSRDSGEDLPKSPKPNETLIMEHKDIMSHKGIHNVLCRPSEANSLEKHGIERSLGNTPKLRNIRTLCPIDNEGVEKFNNCNKKSKNKQKKGENKLSAIQIQRMQRELDLIKPAEISFTQLPTEGNFGKTVKGVARKINKLFPQGFTLSDIYDFLSKKQREIKAASFNSQVYAVKCLVKAALGMHYDFDPSIKVTVDRCFKKFIKKVPKNLSVSRAVRYETLLDFVSKARPRVALMVKFLYQSCMRVSPMCTIKLSDIEPVEGEDACWVRVIQKNGVLTSPKVSSHLVRQIIAECSSKVYLFENKYGRPYTANYIWQLFAEESRLQNLEENIHPHRLRHSHATHSQDIRAALVQGGWQDPGTMFNTYSRREYKIEELPCLDDTRQLGQGRAELNASATSLSALAGTQPAKPSVFCLGQSNTVEQLLEQKANAEALLLDINNKLLKMYSEHVAQEPNPLFPYTLIPQVLENNLGAAHRNERSTIPNGRLNSKMSVVSDNPVISRLSHTGCFERAKYRPLNISNGFGYNREREGGAYPPKLSTCKSCGELVKTCQQGKCKSCLEPSLRASTLLINQFRDNVSINFNSPGKETAPRLSERKSIDQRRKKAVCI